jgi:hypothetical protein
MKLFISISSKQLVCRKMFSKAMSTCSSLMTDCYLPVTHSPTYPKPLNQHILGKNLSRYFTVPVTKLALDVWSSSWTTRSTLVYLQCSAVVPCTVIIRRNSNSLDTTQLYTNVIGYCYGELPYKAPHALRPLSDLFCFPIWVAVTPDSSTSAL